MATEGALLQYNGDRPLEVISGEQFAHGVTIRDDLNNQARVVLKASIQNNSSVKLDAACVGEKITLKGKPGEYAYLYLHTTSTRLSYISLWVKLFDCPPGFIFSETFSDCVSLINTLACWNAIQLYSTAT